MVDQVFRLAKFIDNELVTTDQLTPEQAAIFVHTAQHMIDHLRREFNLAEPGKIACTACDGTGETRGPLPEDFGTCKHCKGTGFVKDGP